MLGVHHNTILIECVIVPVPSNQVCKYMKIVFQFAFYYHSYTSAIMAYYIGMYYVHTYSGISIYLCCNGMFPLCSTVCVCGSTSLPSTWTSTGLALCLNCVRRNIIYLQRGIIYTTLIDTICRYSLIHYFICNTLQ